MGTIGYLKNVFEAMAVGHEVVSMVVEHGQRHKQVVVWTLSRQQHLHNDTSYRTGSTSQRWRTSAKGNSRLNQTRSHR